MSGSTGAFTDGVRYCGALEPGVSTTVGRISLAITNNGNFDSEGGTPGATGTTVAFGMLGNVVLAGLA